MPYGTIGHIGIARETTWGTPVAVASGDFFEALSENVTLAIDRFETKNIVGRFAEPDDVAGLRRYEGELVVPAHPVVLGHLLNAALNIRSRTVVLSGFLWEIDYRPHATDEGTNNPVTPYTLEIFRDVTSAFRYGGVQVTKLGFAVEANQDLRVTAGLLAKTSSIIAKSTPTYPASPTDPFTFDTTSVSISGAVDYVESLAIDFDSQLEGIPALNASTEIARVRRSGPQLVRVSGTVAFESLAEYDRFVQQSESNFIANWTKADSFSLRIRIPRLVYTAFPLGMGGRERLTVGFEGMGRYSDSQGYAIQVKLTTTKSNY